MTRLSEPDIWETILSFPNLERYTSISDAASRLLSNSKPVVSLPRLRILSEESANAFSQGIHDFSLGIKAISLPAASALAGSRNSFTFPRVKQVCEVVALSLSKIKGEVSMPALEELSDSPSHLALLKKIFLRHKTIPLRRLTPKQASLLASTKGGELRLLRLRSLSPETAHSLAEHAGSLEITIPRLSARSAEALSPHKGNLWLKTPFVSEQTARGLSLHRGKVTVHLERWGSGPGHHALSQKMRRASPSPSL